MKFTSDSYFSFGSTGAEGGRISDSSDYIVIEDEIMGRADYIVIEDEIMGRADYIVIEDEIMGRADLSF